jgi:membrane associated rhomboid family serine protease
MDLNHILFLVALLNLLGDLYNIYSFRRHIPRWIAVLNLGGLAGCLAAKLLAPAEAGFISIGIFVLYFLIIKATLRAPPKRASFSSRYTRLLIALTGACYLYQVSQTPLSLSGLVGVGAFYGPLFEAGEWWRLFTAQFLHWGFAHLAFNMLGLWVLGPRVESRLGATRFIAAYLLCGAGGILIAWGASKSMASEDALIMLGASASVLALVGISAAVALTEYRRLGNIAAKAQLSTMIQIVALQAIFDAMVPEVSSTAHLGGALCGFIVGLVFSRGAIALHRESALQSPESQPQPPLTTEDSPL